MALTMTKHHENLLRYSTLSLLSMIKLFSSLETKMILKIPNETFLRITWYNRNYARTMKHFWLVAHFFFTFGRPGFENVFLTLVFRRCSPRHLRRRSISDLWTGKHRWLSTSTMPCSHFLKFHTTRMVSLHGVHAYLFRWTILLIGPYGGSFISPIAGFQMRCQITPFSSL